MDTIAASSMLMTYRMTTVFMPPVVLALASAEITMKNTRIGAHEASAVLNSVPRSSMAAMLGHASASAMPTAKPMTMRLMRLIEPQTSTIVLKMPMEAFSLRSASQPTGKRS